MKASLIQSLPLLIGAIFGVLLQYLAVDWIIRLLLGLVPVAAGLAIARSARSLMPSHPVRSVHLWQWQVLVPIGALALATWGLAELLDWGSEVIVLSNLFDVTAACATEPTDAARRACETARLAEITTALAAAVTTFVGAMFLDDLEGQEGGWWPPAQIRSAMQTVFAADVERRRLQVSATEEALGTPPKADQLAHLTALLQKYERLKHAVYSRRLSVSEPMGWSYGGALARARELQAQLPELRALKAGHMAS